MEGNNIIIPDGWSKIPIGECVIEKKKSPINVEDANEYGQYPFFTSGESVLRYDDKLVDGENLYIADGGTADVKYYNGGSAYSNHTYVLGCKNDYCTKFIYYVLLYLTDYIDKNYFQGTGLKNLQKKDFKRHEIIVPKSKDEQQRIADALTKIDDAMERTQQLIDKYELVKCGLMQDLLTYGIDKDGNIRNEKTHKFKDSPIGRIPQEWECVTFKDVAGNITDYIKTGPFGSSLKGEHWRETGVPVITIGALGEEDFINENLLFISEEKANELYKYSLKNISPSLRAPGMLFSDPLIVKKFVTFRNEYVHNGPWDLRSSVYYTAVNGEPADVVIYSPDMDEHGNFVKSGSRNKFYATGAKINTVLPALVSDVIDVLSKTKDKFQEVLVARTTPATDEVRKKAADAYVKVIVRNMSTFAGK